MLDDKSNITEAERMQSMVPSSFGPRLNSLEELKYKQGYVLMLPVSKPPTKWLTFKRILHFSSYCSAILALSLGLLDTQFLSSIIYITLSLFLVIITYADSRIQAKN